MNSSIRLIISDLDGTLIDTYSANLEAYREAIKHVSNIDLTAEQYSRYFGLKFSDLCDALNIPDKDREHIKEYKSRVYSNYFNLTSINTLLLETLKLRKKEGIKIALGTTAASKNVNNILNYHKLTNFFDYILTGDQVINGKPDPEVYRKIMSHFKITPDETIIYEDSSVGIEAAERAHATCIKVEKWN